MKKIAAMLCMLTCVFGLTACGSKEAISDMENKRCETAKIMATDFVVPFMMNFFDDSVAKQYQTDYNVHELEALTENELSYYLYFYSSYGINYEFNAIDVDGIAILNGITSFNSAYKSLGEVDATNGLTAKSEVSGDKIIVTVPLTGTLTDKKGNLRTAEAELIFSNDIFLKVESCTLNLNQSTGELIGKAAMDTVMGMGTVFTVLILISLIIWAMGGIPKLQEKLKNKKKDEVQKLKEDAVDNTIAQIIEKEERVGTTEDLELAAVIAAAVAAYEGAAGADGFVVRSIRKRR